jgi:hypothetical protein
MCAAPDLAAPAPQLPDLPEGCVSPPGVYGGRPAEAYSRRWQVCADFTHVFRMAAFEIANILQAGRAGTACFGNSWLRWQQ